jgi:hypothetical protein
MHTSLMSASGSMEVNAVPLFASLQWEERKQHRTGIIITRTTVDLALSQLLRAKLRTRSSRCACRSR